MQWSIVWMVSDIILFFCWPTLMHWNTGLIGHLRTHFPTMFRLYLILKDRDDPPTVEEQEIASGRKADAVADYLGRVETASANILSMFAKQHEQEAVSLLHIFDIILYLIELGLKVGSRDFRMLCCRVDCCMWPAIWWGRQTRIPPSSRIHTPASFPADSSP